MTTNPQPPAYWSPALKDAFWTAVNAPTYDESAAATLAFAQLLAAASAVVAVAAPPTGQTAEVERLREQLEEAEDIAEQLVRNVQTVARERESYRKAWKEEQQRRVKAEAEKKPADRAAVLNAAAQHLYTALFPAVYDDLGQKAAEGVNRAVSELRRLADEAQQPCGCGEPSTPGTVHRTDGPCYVDEAQQPETRPAPDVVAAIVDALEARAGELQELAEEQMRPSLEERAQEWLEAAEVARRASAVVSAVPPQPEETA